MKEFFKSIFRFKVLILVVLMFSFALGYFLTQFIYNPNFSYYRIDVDVTDTEYEKYFSKDYYKTQESNIKSYNKYVTEYNNKEGISKSMSKIFTTTNATYDQIFNDMYYKDGSIWLKNKVFTTTAVTSTKSISEGVTKFNKFVKAYFDSGVKDYTFTLDMLYTEEEIASGKRVDEEAEYDENGELVKEEISHALYAEKTFNIEIEGINIKTGNVAYLYNYQNPYAISSLFALGGLVIILVIVTFLFLKGKLNDYKEIHDNEEIFKTPFHKKYWTYASKPFEKVSNIAMMAILFAMMIVCKFLHLPSGFGALGLSLTYIFFSIIALIYGPLAGIIIGALSDTIGFFLGVNGSGPWFFGYTLDAMMAGFTYGICFYRTKVTFSKCFYARLFVNIVINAIFGTIWWSMMNQFNYDQAIQYFTWISLPKNLLYLVPQTLVLYLVLKGVIKVLARFNYIDERIGEATGII